MYTVQQATIFNERLYAKINDEWGEPEKEEKVEFDVVDLKRFEEGIKVELKPKEGFTSLWNKVRKNILGIKTPSERFEESMKDFKWCDEETVNRFHKNLADALTAHVNKEFLKDKDEKKKTLNEIRKEYGFDEVNVRKLEDKIKAQWNHDMLKAHLNEKLVSDNVHAPEHYQLRGLDIEAIDVIRGALTEDEFRGFCKGNVLKYTIREGHKNGDEDLKKAKKYLEFLEEDDSDE